LQILDSPLFGKFNLPYGGFLILLGEPVRENDQFSTIEESQETVAVTAKLRSDLPDFFGSNKFLEILRWYQVNALDEPQDPRDLLRMLVTETIEEFLDGTPPVRGPVELDGAHGAS
jgi:hypothetical protein